MARRLPRSLAITAWIGVALLCCTGLVLILLLFATFTTRASAAGPTVDRTGVATVRGCVEYGPISQYGLGYVYSCRAQVHWSDGSVTSETFPPGTLTVADVGERVPVYFDSGGWGSDGERLGRNESARFSAWFGPGMLMFPLLALIVLVGAVLAVLRVVARVKGREKDARVRGRAGTERVRDNGRSRERDQRWPISPSDRAAAPASPATVRMRLLALWCVAVGLYALFATVPRYDAPRAVDFESPWPGIARSYLVDPPTTVLVVVLLILLGLVVMTERAVRAEEVRTYRYGPAYLARHSRSDRTVQQLAASELTRQGRYRRRQRRSTLVIGLVVALLAVWATVRVVVHGPASAPAQVWAAALRDAVLLAALAAILLSTLDSSYDRLKRHLRGHPVDWGDISGTSDEVRAS